MDYSTDALVASVKLKASVPSTQALFPDDDIIEFLQTEMISLVVSEIMRVREEYLCAFDSYTTDSTGAVPIPTQALGLKFKMLEYVYPNDSSSMYPLSRIEYQQRGGYCSTNQPGQPAYFYLLGNKAYLWPQPGEGGATVRRTYFRRPNTLTNVDNCGQISAIDTGTNTVTCTSLPSSWTTGTRVDLIQGTPGFDALYENVAIVSVAGFDVVLASVDDLSVGDWLAPTGFSPVPQIIYEGHNLIAQAAAVKVMESLSDEKGMKNAQAKLEEIQAAFLTFITPRAESAPKRVVQMNGPLQGGRWSWGSRR